ncbi:hypothetical protein BGZ98_008524, partial [Dissophora globulifera]
MAAYSSQHLTWNSAHTINREGRYCYCGHDRRLDELSLQCKACHNWFHASCVEVPLGPVVPFITNYKFLCKYCVVKPTGKGSHQQQQQPQDPTKEPATGPEFFERVTAGWKEICVTTIANLIIQEYLKVAAASAKHHATEPPQQHLLSKEPSEENMWSVNAEFMGWDEYRFYFNKKDHILPWATLGSCLYIAKDVFAATDEQARSASSDFCLVKSNLWNMKPGHISSHQSSKTPREGKRKVNAVSGSGQDEGGSRKTGTKSDKKSKSTSQQDVSNSSNNNGGGSHNNTGSNNNSNSRRTATPPVIAQTTYIPRPNTVVPTKSGENLAPFSTSNEHPYNRHRFRYVTCEPDPLLQYMLYRQTANPVLPGVRLCREDMSPYMFIDEECMTITTEKGFRMVRANCGVREGKWFYEVTIGRGGEPRFENRDGAHVRLGWARREATLQAPVGFDAYSYGIRDTTGEKVHMSRVAPFGEPFKTGDVIGLFISLPPDGNEKSFFKHRRLRKPFYFKGQLYFESIDYSPTKRYIEMAEYEATPVKTNLVRPVPPPVISGSKIIVYKNGVCQGVMCEDLLALLPIEQNAKEKDQVRFDDGTLGYYPVISVYRNGTATANFGPDFKFPPSKDPEAEAENILGSEDQDQDQDQDLDQDQDQEEATWRPMSDRWEEKLIEESLIDLVDEVELWVSEQAVQERGLLQYTASKLGGDDGSVVADETTLQGFENGQEEYDDGEMSSSGRQDRSSVPMREGRGRDSAAEEEEHDDDDNNEVGDGDVGMDSGVEREQTREDRD